VTEEQTVTNRKSRFAWRDKSDLASGIYGTLLVTAEVVAVSSHYRTKPLSGAILVLVTTVVFWLAHVYANTLALRHRQASKPSWPQYRDEMIREWPIIEAGVVPVLVLLLGAVGLFSSRLSYIIATWWGVAALMIYGIAIGRKEGRSAMGVVLTAFITACFGFVIILLKILIA
jgi:hypothetical protein